MKNVLVLLLALASLGSVSAFAATAPVPAHATLKADQVGRDAVAENRKEFGSQYQRYS